MYIVSHAATGMVAKAPGPTKKSGTTDEPPVTFMPTIHEPWLYIVTQRIFALWRVKVNGSRKGRERPPAVSAATSYVRLASRGALVSEYITWPGLPDQ